MAPAPGQPSRGFLPRIYWDDPAVRSASLPFCYSISCMHL